MNKIMELAEEYASAVAEDAQAEYTVSCSATVQELMQIAVDTKAALAAEVDAHIYYTRAVIAERDALKAKYERLRAASDAWCAAEQKL